MDLGTISGLGVVALVVMYVVGRPKWVVRVIDFVLRKVGLKSE
jgi:hypothetical protein